MTDPIAAALSKLAANLGALAGDFSSEKRDGAALVVNRIAKVVRKTADEIEGKAK